MTVRAYRGRVTVRAYRGRVTGGACLQGASDRGCMPTGGE